jgi:hypothetical protein
MSAPPGAQRQSAGSGKCASRCDRAAAVRVNTESAIVYTIPCPSGDHATETTISPGVAGSSGRALPPDAGALNTPPWARKRIRVPSGDHCGSVWTSSESSVSARARPPLTCRTKIRMLAMLPDAYATLRPSGESAGAISSPGSHVTFVARPKLVTGSAPVAVRRPAKNATTATTIDAASSARMNGTRIARPGA